MREIRLVVPDETTHGLCPIHGYLGQPTTEPNVFVCYFGPTHYFHDSGPSYGSD